jgi:hypothetical protein
MQQERLYKRDTTVSEWLSIVAIFQLYHDKNNFSLGVKQQSLAQSTCLIGYQFC